MVPWNTFHKEEVCFLKHDNIFSMIWESLLFYEPQCYAVKESDYPPYTKGSIKATTDTTILFEDNNINLVSSQENLILLHAYIGKQLRPR